MNPEIISTKTEEYKELIESLKKDGFEIKTVLTKSGKQFVTPLSLISLSSILIFCQPYDGPSI